MNKNSPIKRSVRISGHRTSVSLEPEFWGELEKMAREKGKPVSALVAEADSVRQGNLSSELRLMVLRHLRKAVGSLRGSE